MNPEDARKELIAQLDRSKIFEPVHTQDFAVFYCSLASACSENAAYEVITKFVEQVLELSESDVWSFKDKRSRVGASFSAVVQQLGIKCQY